MIIYVYLLFSLIKFSYFKKAYLDLQSRKETREAAWRKPGWDECFAYSVPLIQQMHTKIMIPLPFSPTQ
jgi:hypothetical protein